MIINIYTDGGARGNPGPAGAGFVVQDSDDKTVHRQSQFLGRTTNNVAEYKALLLAYRWLKKNFSRFDNLERVIFHLDSQLVIRQLKGEYKIKAQHLRPLVIEIKQEEGKLPCQVEYRHIPREKNQLADGLANEAMDRGR